MYRVRQRIPLLYISLLADVIHHVPTSGEILHFQIEKFAKHELVFVVYAPRYSGGGRDMARSNDRRKRGTWIIGYKSTKIFLSKQVFPRFFLFEREGIPKLGRVLCLQKENWCLCAPVSWQPPALSFFIFHLSFSAALFICHLA